MREKKNIMIYLIRKKIIKIIKLKKEIRLKKM